VARAEGTVNIEVKGALQGALEVRTLAKSLDKLDRAGKKLSSGAKTIETYSQNLLTANVKTRKVFDSMDKGIKMMGMGLTKGLMLALKATVLQFGVFSLALMGVHALFIAGKWLHKAYSWGMTAMAGAAASAAVALGTAAAAIREQQAAMYAFTKGGAGEFLTGTNQVRVAMRTLQTDSQLAGLGVAALNKAYAAMAKSMKSSQIAQSGGLMKNLMDFGAAGQDPAAAADKVGALIEALNNSKTSMAGVRQAAKALGPQMEQALKKAKVTSKKQMKELIMSGELAKAGGVAGQFEAVNSTLIGQAKSFFNQIKAQFADFGQEFLEPAKVAMTKIFRIIRNDLKRVSGSMADFGESKFFDGLVATFEKISNFFVKLIREWLPKTDGFFQNMGKGWEKFARWFRTSREQLRPFVEGAKSIEGIFKPILEALKAGFLGSFKDFNAGAISNKETFAEIGQTLGSLITELFKLSDIFSTAFRDALPFLSDVIKGITQVVGMMTGMLSKFSGILGGPMAYMALLMMGRQMKSHKGGFLGKERAPVNTMNVIAKTVVIGGKPIPGSPGTPPGGPGTPPIGPVKPIPGGPGTPPVTPGTPKPIPGVPVSIKPRGKPLYDQHGTPLYGGRRHPSDTRQFGTDSAGRLVRYKTDYPNRDAKLVGRGAWVTRNGKTYWNSGAFNKKTPGAGDVGITGRGGAPYPASPTAGSSTRPIMMAHQRYQIISPTAPGPSSPIDGLRLSSGAMPGPGGGGTGGMPGPGGPGTAPPGAGGPAMSGAYSRPGFFRRISEGSRQQAQGQTGVGQDLFRSSLTGRMRARAEIATNPDGTPGDYTGRVIGLNRGIDPLTGLRTGRHEANYDPQTGFISTKGIKIIDEKTGKQSYSKTMANKLKYSGRTARSTRNSALGSAVLGNAEKGIGGINNSMGAKMAVGMGMSMASQYMPEEAQGAMALGGMVGQFNPLAGLAVGLGGAALNSKTAAGGALTGAGAGAAIGTMIAPGIGTAVGAALGAITGAIAGFAGGIRQRAKESKEAMGSFLDGISARAFNDAQGAAYRQQADADAGVDMSGREGAYSTIAGETAAAYAKLDEKLKKGNFRGKYSAETSTQAKRGAIGGGLAGAAGGAAYGAAVGSLGGPLGTLAGAGLGALIGGIAGSGLGAAVGGVWGKMTGSKRKKQQKKDFNLLKEISEDPAFRGIISPEEMASINKDKGAALTKLAKELPDRMEAATAIADQQSSRMKVLQTMSGKSGAELEVLAKKMGVDLYDATAKTSDIVKKLALTMVKSARQMEDANIDASVNAISSVFDEAIKSIRAPEIYDEAGAALRSTIKGGGDTVSVLGALEKFQTASVGLTGDGAISDFYNQKRQLGTAEDPGNIFGPGGAFHDMDPADFFTPKVTEVLTASQTKAEKGFIDTATGQIQGQLGEANMYGNKGKMAAAIKSMPEARREQFLKDVTAGTFTVDDPFKDKTNAESKAIYTAAGYTSKAEYVAANLNNKFSEYGATTTTPLNVKTIDNRTNNAVAKKMLTASDTFKTAVDNFNKDMKTYFGADANKPDWWSIEAMKEIMKGDTSTPRGGTVGDTTSSRISQTMARHDAINGSIAGSRSITSGYRTYGLGSLNSDHITGRAIDLVGQNLGSYAVATRNAGGFAEFHGSGGDRHLHAVPGPGAIGDTLTPSSNQMSTTTSATVASGTSSYTFHINGGQNNPEQIANMVMAKIKNSEQRTRERI